MVFVETPWFSEWCDAELGPDGLRALQDELLDDPERGDLISGGQGLRKIRVRLPGRGKRGGGRVIYYYWRRRDLTLLLMGYAKSDQEDLTKDQYRRLAAVAAKEFDNG